MSYNLILKQDVVGLGIVGDVVSVADGYARNFLMPKGLAEPHTAAAEQRLAERRTARQAELETELVRAESLASVLRDNPLVISAKVVEEDKLYGSVGIAEIAAAAAKFGVKLEKDQVLLDSPIKEIGEQHITIRLHPQVRATAIVTVVKE